MIPLGRAENHPRSGKPAGPSNRTSFDTAAAAVVSFGRSRPTMAKIYSDITATIGNTRKRMP